MEVEKPSDIVRTIPFLAGADKPWRKFSGLIKA